MLVEKSENLSLPPRGHCSFNLYSRLCLVMTFATNIRALFGISSSSILNGVSNTSDQSDQLQRSLLLFKQKRVGLE